MTTPGFCGHCGAALSPNMRFCASCGATVEAGAPQPVFAQQPRKGGMPLVLVGGALVAIAVVAFLLLSGGDDKASSGGGGGSGGQSATLGPLRFTAPAGWIGSDPFTDASDATQFFAKVASDVTETLQLPKGPRIQLRAQAAKNECTQNDVKPGLDRDPSKPVSYGRGGKLKGFELQSPRKSDEGEWSVLLIQLCDASKPKTVVTVVYTVPTALASANQGALTSVLNSLELTQ